MVNLLRLFEIVQSNPNCKSMGLRVGFTQFHRVADFGLAGQSRDFMAKKKHQCGIVRDENR
jgi:hypothetical protein